MSRRSFTLIFAGLDLAVARRARRDVEHGEVGELRKPLGILTDGPYDAVRLNVSLR